MMSGLIDNLGPWSWVILGVVLMGLEVVAPGAFLLWFGLAAVLTGLVDWALDLSWQMSALVFAVLSVGAVLLGRAVTRNRDEEGGGRPALNRRGQSLVGHIYTLDSPIEAGCGRIRVGDSFWRIVGPDAAAGTNVRVVRIEGATLVVEAA
jgi:membrane protein implicated in regulation of membrane protease activity